MTLQETNDLQDTIVNTKTYAFAQFLLKIAKNIAVYRPILTMALMVMALMGSTVLTALGQPPNPFGGSGATKASNAMGNVLTYATWIMGGLAILCIFGIGYKKMTEQPWANYAWAAGIFLGGFGIIGSVAYDIVNLSSTDPGDITLGN